MTERIKLPDPSYSGMCRNAMSEVCIEGCLLHGDGRNFELDPRMTLDRAPNRDINHLKPKLQFEIVKAKQTLIINHLLGKGVLYETIDFIQGRNGALRERAPVPERPNL